MAPEMPVDGPVGILAERQDRDAARLAARLEARHIPVVRIDVLGGGAEGRLTIDGSVLRWGDHDLTLLRHAVVFGFAFELPTLPPLAPGDLSLWQPGPVERQQRYSALCSLLCRLQAAGVSLSNGFDAYRFGFSRFAQLDALRAAGLTVPALLQTNVAADVDAWAAGADGAVWRWPTGRGQWQLFTDRQKDDLMGPDKPPVLLASMVAGSLFRAWAVGGRLAVCCEQAPPDGGPPERLEGFRPFAPAGLEAMIATVSETLGAQRFMVVGVAGEAGLVLYDVDVDPVTADLPPALRDGLDAALEASLCGGDIAAAAASTGLAEGGVWREPMFTRRMLRIQFDMQASKYRGSP